MLDFGGRRTGQEYMNSTCEGANQGSSQVLFLFLLIVKMVPSSSVSYLSYSRGRGRGRASSIGIWQNAGAKQPQRAHASPHILMGAKVQGFFE